MDEKMVDEILNELIKEAGPAAINELTKEDLENLDKPAFEFSKEHEEKMQKLFDDVEEESLKRNKKADKKEEHKIVRVSTPRKILIIAAVMMLLSALAITSVGAWRENFIKYILNVQDEYSAVKSNNTNIIREGKDFRADSVYFGYLPVDYELKTHKKFSKKEIITFENNEQNFIIFEAESKSNISIREINTESGEIEEIIVNGKDMVYCENSSHKIITWNENGKINDLYTNGSKEMLLKVLENIKFVEEKSQNN
ncbi:MAG: DUF4367 domain-containing protein [Clostridia bacterium]|nr:DUF4367 domain-containing protein [Clostridia bacterium]